MLSQFLRHPTAYIRHVDCHVHVTHNVPIGSKDIPWHTDIPCQHMMCIPYVLRALKRKEVTCTLHLQIARWPKGSPDMEGYGVDSDFTSVLSPVKCRHRCTLPILARHGKWLMTTAGFRLRWGGGRICCDVLCHLGVPKILPLLGCFEWSLESSSASNQSWGWVMNSRCIRIILWATTFASDPISDHGNFPSWLSQHFLAPRKKDEKHGFLPSLSIVTAMFQWGVTDFLLFSHEHLQP